MLSSYVDIPNDDPLCPRIHITLRVNVARERANHRFTRDQRSRIANALGFAEPYSSTQEDILDQVGGLIVRLEAALRARKKAQKKKDLTIAKKERNETSAIVLAIKKLLGCLNSATPRVRARISLQLADDDGLDRFDQGERRYSRWTKARLPALAIACNAAKERIQVVTGKDSNRSARSVIEQLARIWVLCKRAEPVAKKNIRFDTFDHFVDVVFDEAKIHYFQRYNLVKKVTEARAKGETTVKSKRDSESDNPRPRPNI